MAADEHRIEHDAMGEVRVPAWARWGAQTQRAVENFPVSGERVDPAVVHALARIKAEAARVNARLADVPQVTAPLAAAIVAAAEEVAAGEWDDHFPIDAFQTGSGTSTNMNVNEVVANLAAERLGQPGSVHPNDHVNASQSSNDTVPSAVHVAVALAVHDDLVPALTHLRRVLRRRARDLADVVKAGRTHLMDATPVTLGQELGGYAAQVGHDLDVLAGALPGLYELPLGGTAVGTGINAPPGFARRTIAGLARRTGLPLVEARDHFAAQGGRDALVAVSGALRLTAVSLTKVANDLRWMGSGPAAGLGELHLPDLQPGSSIMPGKVNPVIPEVVTQVAAEVLGNDVTVGFAGSQGAFELNVFIPVMARKVLASIRLLASSARLLADRCVAGMEPDRDRCRRNAEASPAVATALAPVVGYEATAALVHEAVHDGRPVGDLLRERHLLPDDELDRVLDVEALTRGGVSHPRSSS